MLLSARMQAIFGKGSPWRVAPGPEIAAELEAIATLKKKERAKAKRRFLAEKPMLMRIYTRRGRRWGARNSPHAKTNRAHLYVHGHNLVGFTGVGMTLRRQLLEVAGVKSWQTGDEEFSVVFPPEALQTVADLVKPFARRKAKSLTPA